jgi:hypothetical protein
MINIYTGIVSSPIIQGLFSAAWEINSTTKDSWEDLTINNRVLDNRFYFMGRDTPIPYTSSARSVNNAVACKFMSAKMRVLYYQRPVLGVERFELSLD